MELPLGQEIWLWGTSGNCYCHSFLLPNYQALHGWIGFRPVPSLHPMWLEQAQEGTPRPPLPTMARSELGQAITVQPNWAQDVCVLPLPHPSRIGARLDSVVWLDLAWLPLP